MQSVAAIIQSVYGTDSAAAEKLGVGRSAVSNWKSWERFPARLLVPICQHAREKGVELDVLEIPIRQEAAQ